MQILSIVLFSISASLDNLAISIAYGIKKINIPIWINIVIAIISAIGTLLSMLIGLFLKKIISLSYASYIGSFILIGFGLYLIFDYIRSKNHNDNLGELKNILEYPEKADSDNSGSIEIKEAFTLGIALSLNNMGLGIGASIMGMSVILTTIFSFFFSMVFVKLGYILGKGFLSDIFGKYSPIISSLIIISLGIYQLFI